MTISTGQHQKAVMQQTFINVKPLEIFQLSVASLGLCNVVRSPCQIIFYSSCKQENNLKNAIKVFGELFLTSVLCFSKLFSTYPAILELNWIWQMFSAVEPTRRQRSQR